MILLSVPLRHIDLRIGEPFDNAGLALKLAFKAGLAVVDLVDDHSIAILCDVPRVS